MIIDDIREHLGTYIHNSVFSYGRPFDTALAAAKIQTDQWFIHVDPVTFNGNITDATESAPVSIGFLLQDTPDSTFDETENMDVTPSIEAIQKDAKSKALDWLSDFLDTYKYSNVTYTVAPITRIKNVMSGILLNVTFAYKTPC